MPSTSTIAFLGMAAVGLTLLPGAAQAQGPAVTTLAPARNAVAVPTAGPVGLGFSQAVTAASAQNLRVYGSQRRGRRPGSVSGGGTASLSFVPAQAFAPGERLSVTVPATLLNASGAGAARQVYQFTAATGGSGHGVFLDTTEVGQTHSRDQLLGDIDNDGDLDLLTTGGLFGVFSYLNNGAGAFTPFRNVVVGSTPSGAALADFNQDGFLDLIAGDADNPSVAIALNDGTGVFGVLSIAGQTVAVASPVASVATGDIDGDGDLDFATANPGGNSASVGFNNGSGIFSSVATVSVGSQPTTVQLADVDNDGDLDLLTSNRTGNSVSVRLNNGAGSFSGSGTVAVGALPSDVALADIDGDGDLDLLTTNAGAATVSVRVNSAGSFAGTLTLTLPTGSTPTALSVGDVDADGDLDVVVAQGTGGQVSTWLNNGSGSFAAQAGTLTLASTAPAGPSAAGVTLGDVDGDGDLDLITSEAATGRVVLGRGNAVPQLTGFSVAAGAPGTVLTLTGANLTGTRRIAFAGAAANVAGSGYVVNAAGTQITGVVVPGGAISGPISVTTGGGTASSAASFAVSAAQLTILQAGTSYLPAGPGFDFGSQLLSTASATTTFTLSNPGSLPLLISGAVATGDFSLTGPVPVSVPAGGTATLSVVFQPTAPGARSGAVVVTSNASGLPSYSLPLRGTGLAPPPAVTGATPASAPVGSPVVLTGTNLFGATAVTFAGTANRTVTTGFSVNGAGTQITGIVVPGGATTGPLTVTTPAGTSAGFSFTVSPPPPPTLLSLSPSSGPVGTALTITGTNLLGTTLVSFGGSLAAFQVVNSTTITTTVPNYISTTQVWVISPLGTSNALPFRVEPHLYSLSPTAGSVGATISVDAVSYTTAATATLNGVAIPLSFAGGRLAFTVPAGAASGPFIITTADGTSNALPFTVTVPVALTSIAPASGAAGTVVVLTGTNLQGATAITFPGTGVNTVTSGFVVNAAGTQITGVVVPAGARTGLVQVTTPNGITSGVGFTALGTPGLTLPAWQSVSPVNGGTSYVYATTTDASGNVYIGGTFYGQISLGSTVLTAYGNNNYGFIAKWSPTTRTYLWAVAITAYTADVAGLAVVGSSVYAAGSFSGPTCTLGSLSLAGYIGPDAYVTKLTDAGTSASFVWAQPIIGYGYESATALAVQGSSVYVGGTFADGVSQTSTYSATFGGFTLTSAGRGDAYVAKLTDAGGTGSFVWVRRAGGTRTDQVTALAAQGSSVYVAGKFDSATAGFGAVAISPAASTNGYEGYSDGFVAKLTDFGTTASFVWAQPMGGPGDDCAYALAVQGSSVYVAGQYSGTARLGPVALVSATVIGAENGYVAKLSDVGTTGSVVWAQPMHAVLGDVKVRAVAVSGANVYVAGACFSGARFGTQTLTTTQNTLDCYVAKLQDAGSAGSFAWVQQAGGASSYDQALALAVQGAQVYVGGIAERVVTFGPFTVGMTLFDFGFLASLTDGVVTATTAPQLPAAVELYPNPAHGVATVLVPAQPAAVAAVLTLTDALGRTVRTESLAVPAAGLRHELSLAGLPPGVYLLRVVAGSLRVARQLAVQ